jgi:hypothetical protein
LQERRWFEILRVFGETQESALLVVRLKSQNAEQGIF